ncbi:BACON domain-containing protein [Fimbriimonas ginsengisoli]|nr:BACON domain-containing protein [Fimbriimonas ginsengisoli]
MLALQSASAQAPKITSYTASQGMSYAGSPITLSWTVTGSPTLSLSGIGAVSGSSIVVSPLATTSYTLTAKNASGTVSASLSIAVSPAPAAMLAPDSTIVRPGGGTRQIHVTSKGAWTALPQVPWITVSGPASGNGNGMFTINVGSNLSQGTRVGKVIVAGQQCAIYQDGQSFQVHPRLWYTPGDIAKFQKWAVPQNPTYPILMDVVGQAVAAYDTRFGTVNWKDNGTFTFSPETTEDYALLLAFMYQLETDPVKRSAYAVRAKTMLMYVLNKAALGAAPGIPFRDPHFSIKDRARFFGQTYPLIVDYLYPIFSPVEKATIRKVFLRWIGESKAAYGGNGNNTMGMKFSANNYQLAHFRNVTMWSEIMDPADDPKVDPAQPATTLGNTLHSYTAYATGRWLSDLWTLFDHGQCQNGLPMEGTLYGLSYGWFHDALLTMHNTGLDDPSLATPQMGMVTSSFWNDWLAGYFHLMVNTPAPPAGAAYLGNVFEQFGYCDLLRIWSIPENAPMLASAILLDRSMGNNARADAEYWALRNSLEGGQFWLNRVPGHGWFGNPTGNEAPQQFTARDPFAAPPTDPRPAMAKVFESNGIKMVIGRTGWDPAASLLAFKSSYITENHTTGDAGNFWFYRKGAMLTSNVRGYTGQDILNTSAYANTLTIQNDVPSDLAWFEPEISARGGQWIFGQATGDPTMLTSNGPGYLAADTNLTKLYNRVTNKSSVTDVKLATRTLIWLQPDYVVVYDRAKTGKANRFKRFNLHLPAMPTVQGNKAMALAPNAERLYVTSLLPANGMLVPAVDVADGQAVGETMKAHLTIEDPSNPLDVRFLHVIQGADTGVSQAAAQLLSSSAGTPLEGATIGTNAVLFPHDLITAANPFAAMSYTVPVQIATHYIAGLSPNMTYDITVATVAGGKTFTITPGTHFMTDKAGVLVFQSGQIVP